MKNKGFTAYWLFCVLLSLVLSAYPLYMGIRVVSDMISNGTVMAADYPKYVIPYTPISLAVVFAVLIMPAAMKVLKKLAVLAASLLSTAVFLFSELLLENMVIVTENTAVRLESWQMYMCYVSPEQLQTRTWRPVDVLIGEYSPTFKIHFYIIAIILVLALTGCFYGFADVIKNGRRYRLPMLAACSAVTVLYLGLCIFACFTAFFRDGELTVSPASAFLMAAFFITMGVSAGLLASIHLAERKGVAVPAIIAAAFTLAMYIAEMCLLHGNVYRFGSGFLFDGIKFLVLAPADILIIAASGVITAAVCKLLRRS